jgi:hypothetical protein
MKILLACVALLALASAARAEDKPVAYNRADDPPSDLDRRITAALSPQFTVVDVAKGEAYVSPKPTAASLPTRAKTEKGEILSGYAFVAFVIMADGRASEPAVMDTIEPRLQPFIAEAMRAWRSLREHGGKPVAVTGAGLELRLDVHVAPTEFGGRRCSSPQGEDRASQGWFYAESRDAHSYLWTRSRERAAALRTGLKAFAGVEENTGKSPGSSCSSTSSRTSRSRPGEKVLKLFDETPWACSRKGLQVEEDRRASVLDVLDHRRWRRRRRDHRREDSLWSTYAPTFDHMGHFGPST